MNAGFGQRRVDRVVQPEPRSFQPPQPPPPQQQVVRHEPQKFPSPKPRTTPAPVPVFDENRREKIDRQSSDYGQAYDYNIDYSNYDYYTDFEVQKTQPEVDSNGEARRLEEPLILENPPEGQSQGCLYDCVYDCVSITQLEAYRDCVDFCGKTCTNKK